MKLNARNKYREHYLPWYYFLKLAESEMIEFENWRLLGRRQFEFCPWSHGR